MSYLLLSLWVTHERRASWTPFLTPHDVATAGSYPVFCPEVQGCICSWCGRGILYHTNGAPQSTLQLSLWDLEIKLCFLGASVVDDTGASHSCKVTINKMFQTWSWYAFVLVIKSKFNNHSWIYECICRCNLTKRILCIKVCKVKQIWGKWELSDVILQFLPTYEYLSAAY